MASKTGSWTTALLFFTLTAALAAQDSPLQWPVPRREPPLPEILMGIEELAGAPGDVVLLDARGPGPYEKGHLPGAVPAWSPEEEVSGGLDRVPSLLAERGITEEATVLLYGDADREALARLFWRLRR